MSPKKAALPHLRLALEELQRARGDDRTEIAEDLRTLQDMQARWEGREPGLQPARRG